jgi:sugar lactone lactonase YvrE
MCIRDSVYVVDTNNNRIQKFNSNGTFITKWGSRGTSDGQFSHAQGIAIDSNDNVYVVDTNNNRIQKFNSNGTFITKWGSKGANDGQLHNPHGIAIDSSNNVYVADYSNNRIQKFNSNGTFMAKWGSRGTDDGQFKYPAGIAIDSSNNIYVVDYANCRIQKFKRNDAGSVAEDKVWLTFDQLKNSNILESAITSNLNLVTAAPNGSTVSWSSSNASIIGSSGIVNRPALGNSDVGVTLTATLTKGTAADTKTFSLNIQALKAPLATSFKDVPSTAWYKTHVDKLVLKKIVSGYADNTFKPNSNITRAEFSKMLCLVLGWTTVGTSNPSFPDVALANWSSPYIETMKANGVLSGYPDGTFGPNRTITRGEIAAAIARIKRLSPVVAIFTDANGYWANGQIGACAKMGIISGYTDGTFKPNGAATRAEAAKLISALP